MVWFFIQIYRVFILLFFDLIFNKIFIHQSVIIFYTVLFKKVSIIQTDRQKIKDLNDIKITE